MPRHLGTTGDAHACRKITYPGMNNKSEFTYGPIGGRMKIVETVSGSVTSTKQFIGREERDGSGNVTKQFFFRGLRDGSTNYFLAEDHLSSARTVTDDSGVVQASFTFDPYGRPTKLEGAVDIDFGFAGMYLHKRSGLNITSARAYDASLGRWISRDPIGESGGVNQYGYAANDSMNLADPLGLVPPPDWSLPAIAQILRDAKKAQELDAKNREHGGLIWVNPIFKKVSCRPGFPVNKNRFDPPKPWGWGSDVYQNHTEGPKFLNPDGSTGSDFTWAMENGKRLWVNDSSGTMWLFDVPSINGDAIPTYQLIDNHLVPQPDTSYQQRLTQYP